MPEHLKVRQNLVPTRLFFLERDFENFTKTGLMRLASSLAAQG
jgi:hypothetical protein